MTVIYFALQQKQLPNPNDCYVLSKHSDTQTRERDYEITEKSAQKLVNIVGHTNWYFELYGGQITLFGTLER